MNFWRRRPEPVVLSAPARTPMPKTAEQAHATARQWYRAMLHHADGGRDNQCATAAACFANACALAQMYELRQIRMALMRLAGPGVELGDDDSHAWHPAVPDVPHDGYAVPRVGRSA